MLTNAEPFEILWTLVAFVGLLIAIYGTIEAVNQLCAVRASRTNGAKKLVVKSTGQRETLRIFTQISFLVAGVVAMLRPAPPTQPGAPARVFLLVLLMSGAVLTVLQSLLDQVYKHRLVKYLEAHPPEAVPQGLPGRSEAQSTETGFSGP